jgi:adenylate cyclase
MKHVEAIKRSLRSHRIWSVLTGFMLTWVACLHLLGYVQLGAVEQMDRLVQDTRARWRLPVPDERVVIVDIDEKSLAEQGRWTWPRKTLAELTRRIVDQGGARVLAFDIVFAEPLATDDKAFADAIRGRPVVLGYYFSSDEGGRTIGKLPAPLFADNQLEAQRLRALTWDGYGANLGFMTDAAQASGFYNARVDQDGVVRSLPLLSSYDGQLYESLALAVLRVYQGGQLIGLRSQSLTVGGAAGISAGTRTAEGIVIPIAEDLTALVPVAGAAGPSAKRFQYISASDVLKGRIDASVFKGKIVLVGASAQGIGDRQATAVNRSTPGVEIHATLIAGALAGELQSTPWHGPVAMAVLTLAIGFLISWWMPNLGAAGIGILCGGLLGMLYLLNLAAFIHYGWVMPLAATFSLVVVVAMKNLAIGHFVEGKARRAVIELFGQYVSPELVSRMARRPQDYPIESQNKKLTILFADVRGFTRIAEAMEPQALREYLNRFLTRMTEVVHRHEGTVDKYMGDAIMAFWGAPIDDPRQEDNAVAAAIDMQKAVVLLNEEFEQRGWPLLAIGIGINSGTARVGDMGSQLRRTYTAIGDAVNLAARLEAATKKFNLPVLIGEATAKGVTKVALEPLGETDVPGRTERVRVFCPKVYIKVTPQRVPETVI